MILPILNVDYTTIIRCEYDDAGSQGGGLWDVWLPREGIVRFYIGWKNEQNISYKGVKTCS